MPHTILLAVLASLAFQDRPWAEALVEAHNAVRSENDLPPLHVSDRLMKAADAHARDMAEHEKMSHEGTDGSTLSDRVKRAGYHYLTTGENVALGQETVDEVMEGWMDSPPHKKNILGDFSEIGVGRAEDEDGHPYWCVDFGRPIPELDPAKASEEVVERINAKRAEAKLDPLENSPRLGEAALATAREMAEHDSIQPEEQGRSTFERVERAGYPYREVSQSVASGQPDPEELLKTLAGSDHAEKSLLGAHNDVGVGYARASDGTPYWVVLFGTKR